MKILKIDIINFGKLSHYNLKPSEGLQVILEENGWGKTTLIHFIKAMFYGFSSYNNQSLVKNERKRFTPWNGGVCSGSLTFACDEGTFRIERSFGARESLDRTVVKDVNTGLETDRFGKAPGVILFGLDADGFERSFCYTKKDVSDNSFDTISAKLNELEKTVYDLSSFGQAKKLLEGAKTELENKRGSGLLKNLQAEIDGLDAKIATLESSLYEQRNIEINIIHLDQQIAGKEKEKAAAASELEKAKEESARRQKLQQLLSSRDLLFEQESKLNTDLRSAGIALGPDTADAIREEIRRYEAASQQKSACDTAEKVVRLHELETVFADEDAVSKDLEKISELRKEIIRIDAKIESINLSEPVSCPEETRSAAHYGRLIELCEERETAKKQFREKAAEDQKKKDRTGIITKSAAIAAFATAVLFLTVLKDAVPSFVAYVLFGVSILSFLLPVFLFRKGGTDDSSVLMPYEQEWLSLCDSCGLKDPDINLLRRLREEAIRGESLKNTNRTETEKLQSSLSALRDEIGMILSSYLSGANEDIDEASIRSMLEEKQKLKKEIAALEEKAGKASIEAETAVKKLSELTGRSMSCDEDPVLAADQYLKEADAFRLRKNTLDDRRRDLEEQFKTEGLSIGEEFSLPQDTYNECFDRYRRIGNEITELTNARVTEETRMKALAAETDNLEEIRAKCASKKDRLAAENRKNDIYKNAIEFMEKANLELTTRYLGKTNEAATTYLKRLSGVSNVEFILDTDFSIMIRADGTDRKLDYFSTGWQELVQFCLRVSLCRAMYEKDPPFLLLDDPFSDLDKDRLTAATEFLGELADSFQIFYFVCHPSRAEAILPNKE